MKLKNLLQSPLCLALCLNLAFLLVCLAVCGLHRGSLDDYFMSAMITGAYGGEFDPHTLFVNGAYAYFLKPFYAFFPKVGWYFIFELLSAFAAFTVFVYFMLRQVGGKLGIALSVFLLACLAPDFYLQAALPSVRPYRLLRRFFCSILATANGGSCGLSLAGCSLSWASFSARRVSSWGCRSWRLRLR